MLMPISVFAVVTAQASIRYMVARQAYVISLITYNLAHGESGCDSYLLRLLDVRPKGSIFRAVQSAMFVVSNIHLRK